MRAIRAALLQHALSPSPRCAAAVALAMLSIACDGAPVLLAGDVSDGLVYARLVGTQLDLHRVRLASGEVRSLTDTPNRNELWPYWSETSQRLVFEREAREPPTTSDLWLWDPARGERALTQTPGRDERWAVWSPRDRKLVFAFRGGRAASGLAIGEPGISRPRLLAQVAAQEMLMRPAFAPDGQRLVTQKRGSDESASELWTLALGSELEPLVRDAEHAASKARFTRDGARIVYSERARAGGPHDIASVDLAGGDKRYHASGSDSEEHSAWPSPTRDELVFVSDRTGSVDVFLAPLGAGEARPLTATPDLDEYAPHWSPNGDRVVVTVMPRGVELRMRNTDDLALARLRVIDRDGVLLFETPGLMADWMPAW